MKIMYVILLIFAGIMVVVFRDQKEKKEALERFIEHAGSRLKKEECSRIWIITNAMICALLAGLAVYVWRNPASVGDDSVTEYLVTLIVMAAGYAAYIFFESRYQDLYMNRDSFYHNGKTYRFTSIRSIERGMRTCKVHMMTGEVLNVNQAKAAALEEHRGVRKI